MGMFEQVVAMNEAFGNAKGDPCNIDWERLERQCRNILEEYNELMTAIRDRDLEETRDALCDINVFSLGAHHFLGIDANADMQAVIEGVMTRFCKDADDVEMTLARYANMGVACYVVGTPPYASIRSSHQQFTPTGELLPKDKFLKSVSYRKAHFPPITG